MTTDQQAPKKYITINSSKLDMLLLDILMQCCSFENSNQIDNMCISVYEEACDYLVDKGYLKTKNGRIYEVIKFD